MAPDPYSTYTDRQRTRVVARRTDDEAKAGDASIGSTQAFNKDKGGLFDGLSIAQIIAGAAAAATSVTLASKIGIAGSVIGAAVSSVVTVVSSQLYRKFLTTSAEKLKRKHEALSAQAPGAARRTGEQRNDEPGRAAGGGRAARSGTRIAPERLQAKAEAERSATQRKVIGFSVAAAIVALVASVAIILAFTAGEGLGTKTTPIFQPATESQAADEDDGASKQTPATDDATSSTDGDGAGASSPSSPATADNADEPSTGTSNGGASQPDSTDQGAGEAQTSPATPETAPATESPAGNGEATGSDQTGEAAGAPHSSSASSTAGVAAQQ